MQRDPRAYLWDICDSADAVAAFVTGRTEQDYRSDRRLRSAVERQFEIIGEALNQPSRIAPDLARSIPDLPRIVAFRNLLIHGYAVVEAMRWSTTPSSGGSCATIFRP